MGKRLENFQSLVVFVGYCPLTRCVHHIKLKLKQFTKQEERNAKHTQGNTPGITHDELKQSGIQQSFATFAEKEEKKMTHLKQTT